MLGRSHVVIFNLVRFLGSRYTCISFGIFKGALSSNFTNTSIIMYQHTCIRYKICMKIFNLKVGVRWILQIHFYSSICIENLLITILFSYIFLICILQDSYILIKNAYVFYYKIVLYIQTHHVLFLQL